MSTDYQQVLNTLVNLLETQTGREVMRGYEEPSNINDDRKMAGLYMVMHDNIAAYPAEHRPGDMGEQRIMIIGLCKVADDASGEVLENFELLMTNELENLASVFPLPDELTGLQVLRCSGSLQTGHPYGHVVATFKNFSGV